jgi:tetratricopeptide (TPR) repeat protein
MAMMAWFHSVIGRKEEAKQMWREAGAERDARGERWFPTFLAYWHISMGEIDVAFQFLEKAIEVSDGSVFEVKMEPLWDNIRSDPRYNALLQKLHLA